MTTATPKVENVDEVLAKVHIFNRLNKRDLRKLAKLCVPKSFAKGDTVVEEGATGLGLFVITSGSVEVFKGKDSDRTELGTMESGDILGEIALIDDQPRSASAVALAPTECLLLTRDSFDTLVKKEPEIAWCIVPNLAERIRELHDRANKAEERLDAKETEVSDKEEKTTSTEATEEESDTASDLSEAVMQMTRLQYGLMMGGVKGMTGMVKVWETLLSSFADETELSGSDDVTDVFERIPDGMVSASREAISELEDLPQEMVDSFRRIYKET